MSSRWFLLLLLAAFAGMAFAKPVPATTVDREIGELIASIERLPDAQFLRNGEAHSAAEAGAHLRLKRKNAGARIKSAEDFITYCATGSSLTGKPYRIRLADGTELASADFFRARLREIRAHAPPATK